LRALDDAAGNLLRDIVGNILFLPPPGRHMGRVHYIPGKRLQPGEYFPPGDIRAYINKRHDKLSLNEKELAVSTFMLLHYET
jgi:hypothetical protein